MQEFWGHKVSRQPRATRTSIPSGCARSGNLLLHAWLSFFPMSQDRERLKGWGARRQVGRATPLRDRKKFHGRRAARKTAGILPAEVRPELRAVAALDNVKLITALISFNWISPLSVFSCGFSMGWFPCLTTRVENKALGTYVSEQGTPSGSLQMTTANGAARVRRERLGRS